jgi:hypothetical protein
MLKLINPVLEAETLQTILKEEKDALRKETQPKLKKMRKIRINEAKELNKKYLIILN